MPSLFGWLDNFPLWTNIPYPTRSALLRAMKAALAVAVGTLLTAATAGVLFPATWSPLMILVITSVLQSVDKFLRETQIATDNAAAAADVSVTDVTAP